MIVVKLLLLGVFLFKCTNSQISPVSTNFNSPTNCSSSQYYDISRLSCMPCPQNSFTSTQDGKLINSLILMLFQSLILFFITFKVYNCKCIQSFYFTVNNGGGSINCVACPTGLIQTLDGFDCIVCDQTCQDCSKNGGYRVDLNDDGSPYLVNGIRTSQCIDCDLTNSVFTGTSCSSCKPLIFIDNTTPTINSLKCTNPANPFIVNDGLLIYPTTQTTNTDPNYFNVLFGTDNSVISNYFSNNLLGTYRTCKYSNSRNSTACQALGNMCVLSMYITSSLTSNYDACKVFTIIQNSGSPFNLLYGQSMPWLFYTNNFNGVRDDYVKSGTGDPNSPYIILQFDNKCASSYLSFYAAQYRLNGTLMKYESIDISRFQLCNYLSTSFSQVSQLSPFSATNYQQTCTVSAGSLLEIGRSPIFYDVFLKYSTSSNLYPLPINVRADGNLNF